MTLSFAGVDDSQWPSLSAGAARRADVNGNLRVSGTLSAAALGNNLVTTPAIADKAVTMRKLSTQPVVSTTITIGAGGKEPVAVSDPIPLPQAPPLTQVLVSAFSPTLGAEFTWRQGAITKGGNSQQVVFFHNEGITIEVRLEIHVLAVE